MRTILTGGSRTGIDSDGLAGIKGAAEGWVRGEGFNGPDFGVELLRWTVFYVVAPTNQADGFVVDLDDGVVIVVGEDETLDVNGGNPAGSISDYLTTTGLRELWQTLPGGRITTQVERDPVGGFSPRPLY